MARTKEVLVGSLRRIGPDGAPATVRVYKAGRDYRITHGDARHLCHPSVRSIEKVKSEAFLVFHVGQTKFEPV